MYWPVSLTGPHSVLYDILFSMMRSLTPLIHILALLAFRSLLVQFPLSGMLRQLPLSGCEHGLSLRMLQREDIAAILLTKAL